MTDPQLACLFFAAPALVLSLILAAAEMSRLLHHNGVEMTFGWQIVGHLVWLYGLAMSALLAVLALVRGQR